MFHTTTKGRREFRGFRFGAVALAGLIYAGDVQAQATEGVAPVAVGVWRVDADVHSRGEDWDLPAGEGGRARAEGWGCVQLATGLTERWEARVACAVWQRDELDGAVVEGTGDVVLGAKWRIAGDESEGVAWALMPYLKLPTAGARFADDTVDVGALLIFGRPWGEAGFLNAQAGWDDYGDGAGGRDRGASASVAAGRGLGGRWTVYGEALAGVYPVSGDKGACAASLGGGVAWAGGDDGAWGLDLAVYGGVTRAATDAQAVLRVWVEWGGAGAP